MEFPRYYEGPTENPEAIRELTKGLNPKVILSVIGGGWPIILQDMFPSAEMFSFDIEAQAIFFWKDRIIARTHNAPRKFDILSDEFRMFLKKVNPEILYLSNVIDYLDPKNIFKIKLLFGMVPGLTLCISTQEGFQKLYEKGGSLFEVFKNFRIYKSFFDRSLESYNLPIHSYYLLRKI